MMEAIEWIVVLIVVAPFKADADEASSTALPFADVDDLHLSTSIYLVWGSAVLVVLLAVLVAVLCLEWSACPVYKRREEKKKKNNNLPDQVLDSSYLIGQFAIVIAVPEQQPKKVAPWRQQNKEERIPYERF